MCNTTGATLEQDLLTLPDHLITPLVSGIWCGSCSAVFGFWMLCFVDSDLPFGRFFTCAMALPVRFRLFLWYLPPLFFQHTICYVAAWNQLWSTTSYLSFYRKARLNISRLNIKTTDKIKCQRQPINYTTLNEQNWKISAMWKTSLTVLRWKHVSKKYRQDVLAKVLTINWHKTEETTNNENKKHQSNNLNVHMNILCKILI